MKVAARLVDLEKHYVLKSETEIQICIDLIQELKEIEGVAGVHIMAIEWEEAVKPIAEGADLLPRPVLEPAAI